LATVDFLETQVEAPEERLKAIKPLPCVSKILGMVMMLASWCRACSRVVVVHPWAKSD